MWVSNFINILMNVPEQITLTFNYISADSCVMLRFPKGEWEMLVQIATQPQLCLALIYFSRTKGIRKTTALHLHRRY
jgi:hypothetical protein